MINEEKPFEYLEEFSQLLQNFFLAFIGFKGQVFQKFVFSCLFVCLLLVLLASSLAVLKVDFWLLDSGFDLDAWYLPLCVRFCRQSEEFHGIGMDAPVKLNGKMLVLADGKQICASIHAMGRQQKLPRKPET